MSGTQCSGNTEITLRPQGWALTEQAYVVPIQDGRDTLKLMKSQEAEISALRIYVASQDVAIGGIESGVKELRTALATERDAWEKKTQALSKEVKRLRSPWSLGIFAGWDAIHSEVSVGLGLTYKLIGL